MASRAALFEWEGREYDHDPKSADWYWAVGIVAVAGAVAAALFGNYLFSVVILLGATAIALQGAKQPPLHRFRVSEQGLMIGEEMHPFESMESFSILEDIEGELPPLLSIKTDKWLSSHLMIPLEGVDAEALYAYFVDKVDEGEHHHSLGDIIGAWLRL